MSKNSWKSLFQNPLVWVMVIAFIFGVVDSIKRPSPMYQKAGDSSSYMSASYDLTGTLLRNSNVWRTPVYPAFIALHRYLFGEKDLLEWIVFSQRVLSFFSVFFFYRITEYFIKNKWLNVLTTFSYIFAVYKFCFNYAILTESLAVTCVVCWFYVLTTYAQKPSYFKAFFISFGVWALIMLRPAFLGLLLLLFVFWGMSLLFQREHLKKNLLGLFSSVCVLALILGYSYQVYQKSGIFTINEVSAINQYFCIIQSGLFQKENDPINRRMQEGLKKYLSIHPERTNDPQLLTGEDCWLPESPVGIIRNEMEKSGLLPTWKDKADYTKSMIKKYPYDYAKFVLGKFLKKENQLHLFVLVHRLHHAEIFLFWECFFIIVLWRHSGKIPIFHWTFWLLIAGLYFTAVAGAQNDAKRLTFPAVPFLTIIPFQLLDVLTRYFSTIRQRDISNHLKLEDYKTKTPLTGEQSNQAA